MIKSIVFDLDGTLYCGESAIKGAVDTVAVLAQDYRVFYLTNNSGKARKQIIGKLSGLGFSADAQNTYCSSYAISVYLVEKQIMLVFLVGTDGLKSDLESCGIRVENSSTVSAVVVGLDPALSYDKIATALEAIGNGAKLIIANVDPSYPSGNNRRLPGCGAMVGAIVGATDHTPDFHIGKPNTFMLELICREHGLLPAEICVVGDELDGDIKMAANFQCQSILFDPENVFPAFSGNKVKSFPEIVSLIKERRLNP